MELKSPKHPKNVDSNEKIVQQYYARVIFWRYSENNSMKFWILFLGEVRW